MIIFINGSINSGKSTVAKLLAEQLLNTALVEIDDIHKMINWMSIDQAVPLNLENGIFLIRNFVQHGLHVIVPYPLSQKNYDFIKSSLRDLEVSMFVFSLAPSLEIALTNRGERSLNDWERSRIEYHYSIGIPYPTFGEVIDNSFQSPEETMQYILKKIS